MAKSGRQYGREVRALREAGYDFPAACGYQLANPAQWSAGLKSAVTKAFNRLDSAQDERLDDAGTIDDGGDRDFISDFESGAGELFFEDSAGDDLEEWDDIEYFDFDELDEFEDAEADTYTED